MKMRSSLVFSPHFITKQLASGRLECATCSVWRFFNLIVVVRRFSGRWVVASGGGKGQYPEAPVLGFSQQRGRSGPENDPRVGGAHRQLRGNQQVVRGRKMVHNSRIN